MSQWISEQHRLKNFTNLRLDDEHKRKDQIKTPDGETLDIVDAPDAIPLGDTEYGRKPKRNQPPRIKPDGDRLGSNKV